MTRPRAILWAFSAITISLIALAAWSLAPGDPVTRAASAAKAGRWSEVVAQTEITLRRRPEDPRARRLHARGLVELHSPAARTAYFFLGVNEMEADDFLALARMLRFEKRTSLAGLAIEAAGRIAPDEANVRAARSDFRAKFGREGAIAHVTDHLAAIPGGPPLGELVVDLVCLNGGNLPDEPAFDRFLSRDRAVLRGLNSPAAVRLMVARAMLETQRPGAASMLLNRAETEKGSPEAAWLLSRVHLQMGSIDKAAEDLKRAGTFAADRIHEPEPARYVGARACKACHVKEYDAEQSSRHATTLSHGPDMRKIPLPDRPVADPADPAIVHTFTREGENVRVKTKVGDASYEALLDYALGSGHRGITMIGKDTEGTFRELRISQYSEKGLAWDVTSGFSPHPSDPREYLGKVLSPAGFRDCIHCHTTQFRSIADRSGPEAADRGIGCERCHGPGGNHVLAMNLGFPDPAIARFTEATGPQRMTACSGCHASDGTFPPTDPQFIRFQSTTLPFSKCYVEAKGKLDCVTCHNPHQKLETSANAYEAKCLNCHGPKTSKVEDVFHRVACPVNAKSDCLKCHMPTREDVVPHTSFTDHHIRVHREEKRR